MVRPEDYVPPDARRYPVPPPPTLWQRVRDPLLVTAVVSAGITVWVLAVQVGGEHPQFGMAAGALLVIGLIAFLRPGWGFEFGSRWTFKERPEPSDAYLATNRAIGAVVTVLALAFAAALVTGHWPGSAEDPDGPQQTVVDETEGIGTNGDGSPAGIPVTDMSPDLSSGLNP